MHSQTDKYLIDVFGAYLVILTAWKWSNSLASFHHITWSESFRIITGDFRSFIENWADKPDEDKQLQKTDGRVNVNTILIEPISCRWISSLWQCSRIGPTSYLWFVRECVVERRRHWMRTRKRRLFSDCFIKVTSSDPLPQPSTMADLVWIGPNSVVWGVKYTWNENERLPSPSLSNNQHRFLKSFTSSERQPAHYTLKCL